MKARAEGAHRRKSSRPPTCPSRRRRPSRHRLPSAMSRRFFRIRPTAHPETTRRPPRRTRPRAVRTPPSHPPAGRPYPAQPDSPQRSRPKPTQAPVRRPEAQRKSPRTRLPGRRPHRRAPRRRLAPALLRRTRPQRHWSLRTRRAAPGRLAGRLPGAGRARRSLRRPATLHKSPRRPVGAPVPMLPRRRLRPRLTKTPRRAQRPSPHGAAERQTARRSVSRSASRTGRLRPGSRPTGRGPEEKQERRLIAAGPGAGGAIRRGAGPAAAGHVTGQSCNRKSAASVPRRLAGGLCRPRRDPYAR
jgi:hypothetical protein